MNNKQNGEDCSYKTSTLSTDDFLVLGVLASGPATVEHISTSLNFIRAKVQHIMDTLLERGLVEQQRSECIGKAETYYVLQNTGRSILLDDSLQADQIVAGAHVIIGSLRRNLIEAFKRNGQNLAASLLLAQADLDRENARKFNIEINDLLQKYKAYEDGSKCPDGRYALVLAFYPITSEVSP